MSSMTVCFGSANLPDGDFSRWFMEHQVTGLHNLRQRILVVSQAQEPPRQSPPRADTPAVAAAGEWPSRSRRRGGGRVMGAASPPPPAFPLPLPPPSLFLLQFVAAFLLPSLLWLTPSPPSPSHPPSPLHTPFLWEVFRLGHLPRPRSRRDLVRRRTLIRPKKNTPPVERLSFGCPSQSASE